MCSNCVWHRLLRTLSPRGSLPLFPCPYSMESPCILKYVWQWLPQFRGFRDLEKASWISLLSWIKLWGTGEMWAGDGMFQAVPGGISVSRVAWVWEARLWWAGRNVGELWRGILPTRIHPLHGCRVYLQSLTHEQHHTQFWVRHSCRIQCSFSFFFLLISVCITLSVPECTCTGGSKGQCWHPSPSSSTLFFEVRCLSVPWTQQFS